MPVITEISADLFRGYGYPDQAEMFESWLDQEYKYCSYEPPGNAEVRRRRAVSLSASNVRKLLDHGVFLRWLVSRKFFSENSKYMTLCMDVGPGWAYMYAANVARHPDDLTRKVACEDPRRAFMYALTVDKGPRDDTRDAACRDPEWANAYADEVDKCARADTRRAACKNPEWAFRYAIAVDKCARPDTRAGACSAPYWACEYAKYVDKCTRKDTRRAACKDRITRSGTLGT